MSPELFASVKIGLEQRQKFKAMEKKEKPKDLEFEMFSEAHALYPGRKRFVNTEFKNLKLLKDWKEVLPLLKGAIEAQVKWRERKFIANEFTPEWKNFSNYIDGRWFEESFPEPKVQPKSDIPYV